MGNHSPDVIDLGGRILRLQLPGIWGWPEALDAAEDLLNNDGLDLPADLWLYEEDLLAIEAFYEDGRAGRLDLGFEVDVDQDGEHVVQTVQILAEYESLLGRRDAAEDVCDESALEDEGVG